MMIQTNKFFKTERKGITPIIAIVLLLMMTVAAFGLTFVWVQSTQQDLQENIGKDIKSVTDMNAAQFSIESIYNDTGNISIVVRNTGRYTFPDATLFTVYLNGQSLSPNIQYFTPSGGILAPDETITIRTTNAATRKWDDLLIGVSHAFKIVSPKSTQATATCSSSTAAQGYC
ncbi:MAG: hypothetical protein KAI53_01220 [Candidatus Aenigmarchaeota archaeon]|nr:hypothetical protein [Candidatus Aenigmarchaeota archaeon]